MHAMRSTTQRLPTSTTTLTVNRPAVAPSFHHNKRRLTAPTTVCVAMPKGSDGSSSQISGGWLADRGAQMKQMITPFSDPAANSRLLALCTAQMLCSVATLIHDTYLPVYLSDVLHLSNSKIGNLQAIAQFLSKASGSVSGTLADILSPARLVIFGTLLTTINKPMFAASGWVFSSFGAAACLYWITFGKIFDRMSKGVREAPSKALIGELAAQSNDSPAAAFSLRQAMATLGALVGAATAALAYNLSGKNYVMTFALASVPATIALVLVSFAFGGSAAVKEAADKQAAKDAAAAAAASTQEAVVELNFFGKAKALMSAFKPAYWQALAVVAILYFARFDASFVTLRAKMVMDKASLPVLTSVIMITQAILSTPAGMRAKRSVKDRNTVIIAGTAVLILANAAFAFLPSYLGMVLGALFIGIHMAMTHGVTIGMLSSYIPSHAVPGLGKVSGTAWSFTDMLLGIILAYSNSLAGRLSDVTVGMGLGNTGCFYGGATACVLSMVALAVFSTFGSLGKEELVVQMGGKKKVA